MTRTSSRNDLPELARLWRDALAAVGFYTRLPVWRIASSGEGTKFADLQWAAPLAGIAIGLVLGLANAVFDWANLPDLARGLVVVASGLLLTGALHEDGLADVADGFGGGRDREAKLAIMKDSRLGTYGAAALIVSLGLRAAFLAALTDPMTATLVLVAAHAASRAPMALMLRHLPNARLHGLAHSFGTPSRMTVIAALAIGCASLLPVGLTGFTLALLILALVYGTIAALASRQVGGQTGDVCGALQQCSEVAVLGVCASLLS